MTRPRKIVVTTGHEGNPLDLPVIPEEHAGQVGDFVVCDLILEALCLGREAPPEGETDVLTHCAYCLRGIIHRSSAPDLPKICFACFGRL